MAGAILLLSSMMRKADLQQALRNHEQAGRAGAIKIFAPAGGLDCRTEMASMRSISNHLNSIMD